MGATCVGVGERSVGLGEGRKVGVGVITGDAPHAARSRQRVTKSPTDAKRCTVWVFNVLLSLSRNIMGLNIDHLVGLTLFRGIASAAVNHLLQCIHVLLNNLFRAQVYK